MSEPMRTIWQAMDWLQGSLHAHGPACVCPGCTACQQGRRMLPRLDLLLTILESWSEAAQEEPITAQDLRRLLTLLEEGMA